VHLLALRRLLFVEIRYRSTGSGESYYYYYKLLLRTLSLTVLEFSFCVDYEKHKRIQQPNGFFGKDLSSAPISSSKFISDTTWTLESDKNNFNFICKFSFKLKGHSGLLIIIIFSTLTIAICQDISFTSNIIHLLLFNNLLIDGSCLSHQTSIFDLPALLNQLL
jgi:hypothetical protein